MQQLGEGLHRGRSHTRHFPVTHLGCQSAELMTERTHEILGNERAFDDLHNLHISGEAIAFVGAGASAGLYPLWNELISKLIAETISLGLATEPDKKFWLSLLNTQPQQVVRSIKTKLQGTYGQILRDIFGHKVGADGKSYTPIHSA